MDLQDVISGIVEEIGTYAEEIEAASDADPGGEPGPFGMAVATMDDVVSAGVADTLFPIQSISKVFALELALDRKGKDVFDRIGKEPSGDPFDSVVDLESTKGVPRNPFINAGALVIVDMILAESSSDDAVVDLVRGRLDGRDLSFDPDVLNEGSDLNRAMIHFMKHHDNLEGDADRVLRAYAHQCAIELECEGLALAGRSLARTRFEDGDDGEMQRARRMRTVLGLMMTCGHYDGSGEFAVRVGLPSKSGVGGGIMAIAPELGSIAVFSPNLDSHGNSILGERALEMFANRTGWSVFGPALE